MEKLKIGDRVYYYKGLSSTINRSCIPCEIIKINRHTINLTDGYNTYNRVSPRNVELQKNKP